jgi:hypothetical protein
MHRVTDGQRRARLAARHGIARRLDSVEQAVEQMTCLHSTEPATVYLSAFARVEASRAEIDRALYTDRSVVKQLAMRRTLFVFPRDLLPAVWGSAADRVANQLRARLAKEVEAGGLVADGERWFREMTDAVLHSLGEDGPATTSELRERIPALALRLEVSPGKKYGGSFPIAPRLLGTVAASGQVLRGDNQGGWHVSRPRWTLTQDWLGESPPRPDPSAGFRRLVERWLWTFGPGTEADLVWWLGATKTVVRRALAELGAVEVGLREGTGYLLPDDLDDVPEPEPWGALLPVLDSTTMGWKERAFYVDAEDVPHLFDSNGNAGTTAWWDGRVVGCWVQDLDGVVSVVLRHDVGADGVRALEDQAARLTTWLAGHRVGTVYTSALMRRPPGQ